MSEELGNFLGALDGASAHEAAWLEATVAALSSQGVAAIADLDGAAFEDFSFGDGVLDAAQKRLVRAAITAATTPALVALGTAPATTLAADHAAALLAALKSSNTEARAISPRLRARAAPRGALAGETSPRTIGPSPRQGVVGQPPTRVLAQAFSRARLLLRHPQCACSSDMLDALSAEVARRKRQAACEEGYSCFRSIWYT